MDVEWAVDIEQETRYFQAVAPILTALQQLMRVVVGTVFGH